MSSSNKKSNPFAQYGWMTTKKRGKDDDAIERDRSKAMEARKRKRARPKKPNKKKKKKPQWSDDEDDDSSCLDDFIVDDDEEISQEESSSDEVKKKKCTNTTVQESSSSEEEESFFTTSNKNYSSRKISKRDVKRNAKAQESPSSSDDENVVPVKSTSMFSRFQEEKKDESSSDEELEIVGKHTSRYFSSKPFGKTMEKENLQPTDELQDTPMAARPVITIDDDEPSNEVSRSLGDDDFISDDDEALAVSQAISESLGQLPTKFKRLGKKKKKKKSVSEKKPITKKIAQKTKRKDEANTELKSDHDEDEDQDKLQELLQESDHEEDDVEVDMYQDDEGAKEAQSVLEEANELSSKVLQTMSEWCGAVPQGMIVDGSSAQEKNAMIVDGALALSKVTDTTNHSWISQEEMQQLCPQVKLADYQLIGVNWLALLHNMTFNNTKVNGVLADEMGLGKTVQTICFLAYLKSINKDKEETSSYRQPHIVIVPASVLTNWQREFEKFCPEMVVVKYHGSQAERLEIQERLRLSHPDKKVRRRPLDVVLTTFSYFSSEKPDDRSFLRKFCFDYMVVDEAHCLKNPRGTRYKNLDKFSTSHRLLLTGTPVQNSPKELLALLCFLMPLFSRPTKKVFEEDSKDVTQSMLQHFVALESPTGDEAQAYQKLKQLFAPFVLRRKKNDVLAQMMPPKVRKLEIVPFDETTRAVYDSILAAHVRRREKNASPADSASARQHLFTELRKAANHPLLLRTRHTSEEAIQHLSEQLFQMGYFGRNATCTIKHVREELATLSDFDIHSAALDLIHESPASRTSILSKYTLQEEDLFCAPKCVRLRQLLPELTAKGHRILLFSQWTRCLDLLGCLMDSLGMQYLRLDGQTAIRDRQDLIDKFNHDDSIPVFLLSTRAGGMGINLTAADVCILHDVDFNPFNDLQAEDRCHRLGQKKTVTVIKMVTKGTVDEDIYQMQQRKVKMNAAIMESSATTSKKSRSREEEEDMNNILENAVSRFLSTPKGTVDQMDV